MCVCLRRMGTAYSCSVLPVASAATPVELQWCWFWVTRLKVHVLQRRKAATDPDCFPKGTPAMPIRSSLHVEAPYCAKSTLHSCSINHPCFGPLAKLNREEEKPFVAFFGKEDLKHSFWKSAVCDITRNSVVAVPQDVWLTAAFRHVDVPIKCRF